MSDKLQIVCDSGMKKKTDEELLEIIKDGRGRLIGRLAELIFLAIEVRMRIHLGTDHHSHKINIEAMSLATQECEEKIQEIISALLYEN